MTSKEIEEKIQVIELLMQEVRLNNNKPLTKHGYNLLTTIVYIANEIKQLNNTKSS